jgi:hypothetical protein
LNSIAQIKTVAANGPQGPTTAMMIALNVDDAASAEAFVGDVGQQFKVHRTVAPPNTSMLLISIVGPLSAAAFAKHWAALVQRDDIVRAYMKLMVVADAVQGTKTGQQLSQASLKASDKVRQHKPWWKFW